MTIDPLALDTTVTFLNAIGVSAKCENRRWRNEFLPGIRVYRGTLVINPARVLGCDDIMHEAGHLATLPSCIRQYASGDIEESVLAPRESYLDAHPLMISDTEEDPVIRAILQSGEDEATAWAYAAQVECGLTPTLKFVVEELWTWRSASKDEIEATLFSLSLGNHLGVHGLQAAGMTRARNGFPKMIRWVQS